MQTIETIRALIQTAHGRVILYQGRLDTYRRCNPDIDYTTDPVFLHLSEEVRKAEIEFNSLYDKWKSRAIENKPSLADSIQVKSE